MALVKLASSKPLPKFTFNWFFSRFFSDQNKNVRGLYIIFMFMLLGIELGLPVNYLPINKNVRGLCIIIYVHVIGYWAWVSNGLPTYE